MESFGPTFRHSGESMPRTPIRGRNPEGGEGQQEMIPCSTLLDSGFRRNDSMGRLYHAVSNRGFDTVCSTGMTFAGACAFGIKFENYMHED